METEVLVEFLGDVLTQTMDNGWEPEWCQLSVTGVIVRWCEKHNVQVPIIEDQDIVLQLKGEEYANEYGFDFYTKTGADFLRESK